MSSETAIRVDGLSKRYLLQHKGKSEGLRHAVQEAICAPFRKLRAGIRNSLNNSDYSDPQLPGVGSQPLAEEFWALRDVSFEIKRGEVIGIIGRNGAGKSTLLKILSRITEPTTGRIEVDGRVASLLEVGTGFHPELTGRENIYLNGAILGMTRAEVSRKFDEIVGFAEVEKFLDTPVKRYSSGMYVRLAFAVAAHLEPEILIIDEVLAVGDAEFQKKCLGKIGQIAQGQGRTVLFVSHNMAAVRSLCQRAILLQGGSVTMQDVPANVITEYLRTQTNGVATFATGPLQAMEVLQTGATVVITGRFKSRQEIDLPCLGFVIYDAAGTPICGTNPRLSNISRSSKPTFSGEVRAVLQQPRLLDGSYSLSVWFGDSGGDMVHHPNCVNFNVGGMAGDRQLDPGVVGAAKAECEWFFS